jgi:protein ImuA
MPESAMRQTRLPAFPLRPARVHEVCGPSATAFAAVVCAQGQGEVLWISESWRSEAITPTGLVQFFDPARLLVALTRDQTDSLAVAEEALKDGALALVVVETTRPLDLREGRRLQLAAKDGGSTGLCLIPEAMGSNAAETRWQATPLCDPAGGDSTLMRWEIKKNKSGTIGIWDVRWDAETRHLHVVSPAGERPDPAGAAG